MRQTFNDYNETCEMMDGYVTFYPYNMGLLMLVASPALATLVTPNSA
jgi:hypothetical protein